MRSGCLCALGVLAGRTCWYPLSMWQFAALAIATALLSFAWQGAGAA